MKLNAKIFLTITSMFLVILILASYMIFSVFNKTLLTQAKGDLKLIMQQNSSIINNLITRTDEVMLTPANDRLLYNILSYKESNSFVEQTIVKRDLNAYFLNNIRIPLQKYISNFNYHFFISPELSAETLYKGVSLRDGNLHSQDIVSASKWFKETVKLNGQIYWYTTPENPNTIYGSRLINGFFAPFNIQHLGVVRLELDIQDLFSSILNFTITKNSSYFFVDLNNKSHTLSSEFTSSYSFDEDLRKQSIYSPQVVDINNQKYLLCSSQLSNDWYLSGITPVDDVYKERDNLYNIFILISILSIIVSIFLSIYIARRISKPISELSETMQQVIKDKKLDVKIRNTSTILEISHLYSSFQTLIDRINELLVEVYTRGINVKSAEIRALQAQINPHFLYNTLDAICWAAHDAGNTEIPRIISSLSDILRYSIMDSNKLATIADELEIIRNYFDIQRFCYSLDITFIEDIQGVSYENKLPKLTLQPLVENAIIHGMLEQGKKVEVITIRAFHRSGAVVIQVENSYDADIGLMYDIINEKKETEKHGIKNIHSRLKMMFGPEYGLSFSKSDGGGVIVEISLPG